MEVCDGSDFVGSTEFIINHIEASAPGSHWAVGTEKHLVERLASEHPDKTIESINPFTCLCGTMNRITIQSLCWILEEICDGNPIENQIKVDAVTAADSVLALNRMLELS
jgi:quinolinate synthase